MVPLFPLYFHCHLIFFDQSLHVFLGKLETENFFFLLNKCEFSMIELVLFLYHYDVLNEPCLPSLVIGVCYR